MPGLVEASVKQFKPNINKKWIVQKLLQRRTYSRIKTILREEGFAGLTKRLARW